MTKKIAFSLYFIITCVLIAATVIEKFEGTTYIQENVYTTWWFYILWGAMTLFSVIYMTSVKLHKKFSSFMLHISFIIILLGAITTALTAEHGAIYLPLGETQTSYTSEDNINVTLPFSITLEDFKIEYYSGTKAEADYISCVSFQNDETITLKSTISMNKIAKFMGYRFYQSEYDKWGSVLSVNRDVYGIPLTYTGYFLLALSLLLILVSPQGTFRKLLRSPLLRKGAMMIIFLIAANSAYASNNEVTPRTLSVEQIEKLKDIQVVYNERVMPLTSLSHDFTLKLTGSTKYKDLSSDQFFWGWLFFPKSWENEQIFNVPLSEKQEFLQLRERSSYKDFFTEKGVYKLNHYMRNTEPKTQAALLKKLKQLNEKVQLVAMLRSGAMIKIFPYKDSAGTISWYSPSDELPSDMTEGQVIFIKNSINILLSAVVSGNKEDFDLLASKIVSYQQKYGEESLMPSQKVKAERLYYSLSITNILYRSNLVIGILAILTLILMANNRRVEKITVRVLKCSMIHAVGLLALYIGLKWYITDRMPLVNGFDTMMFLGWCVAAVTLYISRHSPLFTAMGVVFVGFTMLVATLGGMNPQITPLMPVLNSPFLTTHVCFIMLSYTLFTFTFINGIIAITIGRKNKDLMQRITIYSRIFLILGIVFLTLGIFIGAIWANVSWGRYWAWDPKEVWALITMMLYALPLHGKSISMLRNEKAFHIYMIVAFLSVLMTYFGVNYILGGMHSYA